MDPRKLFADDRLSGFCVFCGSAPESRDHCPSRVLLDDPLPPNLPVVEACARCNNSFSMDEEYVACILEVALCGSVAPDQISRPNIRRILLEKLALATQISESKRVDRSGGILWEINIQRVRAVVLKLARGHVAYELSLPMLEEPDNVSFVPLILMSEEQRSSFEFPDNSATALWPEIGSRAFIRAAKQFGSPSSGQWIVVQPGRYRYLVSQSDGDFVQIVLSEYLACRVAWH